MKKFSVLLVILLCLFTSTIFAQDMKVKDDKVKIKDKGKVNTGNYTAAYSSDFQMGNPAYVQKIMDIWQDWDDNMLERHDYFSDTLTMHFADGSVMKGKAENLAAAKKYRSGFASVKTSLHAVMPLKSNDKNQDVVAVWGEETNTHPDGKIENKAIHEVWFFDNTGKIVRMRQWEANVK